MHQTRTVLPVRLTLGLLALCFSTIAFGQDKYTISGYIRDEASAEELIGVTVAVNELEATGAVTNVYGFFSLTLPQGKYTLNVASVGFDTETYSVLLDKNHNLNLELKEAEQELEEIVITAESPEENVNDVRMGYEKIEIDAIKDLPVLLGEVDVMKTIQLLPGVASAGEGLTGLYVRGGSADQNLIQLDEATVYNASHLLGFFSVFNADAIKNVEIYKGNIPARFGGRLASVVNIQMREGNSKQFAASGGVGLVSSRLTLEGPIVKEKASFMVSGRRSYADVFLGLSNDPEIKNDELYFYDLNAKANWRINDRNRIYVSSYFGRDRLLSDNDFGTTWGNSTVTMRWNRLFNDRLFMNSTLLYSNFTYGFESIGSNGFDWESSIREAANKVDFEYFMNPKNTLTFGTQLTYRHFNPSEIISQTNAFIGDVILDDNYGLEGAAYIGNEQTINDWLKVEYGLRYTFFNLLGKGRVFVYDGSRNRMQDRDIVDTTYYDWGESINWSHGLEPRLGMRVTLSPQSSIKAGFSRTRQYIQVVSSGAASLPIDRWVPVGPYVDPLISDQYAIGYFRNFKENMFETSVEVFYKDIQHVLDLNRSGEVLLNNNIEDAVFSGDGRAYGLELLVRKNMGRTTGWVAYTLSRTERTIERINRGEPYPARYDKTHDLAIVVNHKFNKRISFSGTWVYATGAAISLPEGNYRFQDRLLPVYVDGNRNAFRMPAFHRLDVALTIDAKKNQGRRWQSSWSFAIYNVYNRNNAFGLAFQEVFNGDLDDDGNGEVVSAVPESIKTFLFGIIPSVTYNFKF